jgi:prepilin-type N-terminal cleavage/methylation domain-containing protein
MKARGLGPGCRRGFTLIELLITLAILGVVMAGLLTVYTGGESIGSAGMNRTEAQQSARATMSIDEKLRLAGYGYPRTLPTFTAVTPTSMTFWADVRNASTILMADLNQGNTTLTVSDAPRINPGDPIYLIKGDLWQQLTVTAVASDGNPGTNDTITVAAGPTGLYERGTLVGRPRQITYSWNVATRVLSMNAGNGTGLQPLVEGVLNLQFRYFDPSDAEIQPAALAMNLGNIRRIVITMTAQSTGTSNPATFTVTSSVRPRNL